MLSPGVFICVGHCSCCFCVVPAADLELGLKRDTLGAVDGSSLEALLKGEPLDRRSGASDLRGPEEDLAAAEPPATSAATHTSSGRVRKVRLPFVCFSHLIKLDLITLILCIISISLVPFTYVFLHSS